MDVETNHLVSAEKLKELKKAMELSEEDRDKITKEQVRILEKIKRGSYTPIPKRLERAARVALRGKKEVIVSRTSGGKLSRWAASKRREKRRR